MRPIKVMIAEDHILGRTAYVEFVRNHFTDITITGEAGNGRELLQLIMVNTPDVVLLDVNMPVMDGRETLLELSKKHPSIGTIIFTNYNERLMADDFFKMGAKGYLHKSCTPGELLEAIKAVGNKGYYNIVPNKNNNKPICDVLSEREREILLMLCGERSVKEIAAELEISEHTVEFHKRNLYRKTQSKGIAGLARFAIEKGLIYHAGI